MWTPQNDKDKDWQKLQAQDSTFYILVIQDHIESIGKPILLKRDEVLLNGLLAQVLSDIAPKPPATFSIQICPNLNCQLGPTGSFYPEPPSSFNIATARNPNDSVTPVQISIPPIWPCERSVIYCIRFDLTELHYKKNTLP